MADDSTRPSYQTTLSGEVETNLVNMSSHGRAGVTPIDRWAFVVILIPVGLLGIVVMRIVRWAGHV